MSAVTIQKCPKVYILETHRSRTPASTLEFVEKMKDTLDMTSFRNATDLDRLGIPVFTCHRLRPDESRTSHTGKGVSAVQAQVSLTMEAIERYSSEYRDEYAPRLIKGSYADLKKNNNVLDPKSLIPSAGSDYGHDREIYWLWGTDLVSGMDILVPACAVYHPFPEEGSFLMNTHTNGIASGNTKEEAVVHAVAEIIERDAWSIAQYNRDFCDAVYVEDKPENSFIIDIIDKFEKAGVEIFAKDVTSDVGIPVIAAFSRDMANESLMVIEGFGAHLDPKVAMVRALLEIATTRALFIEKYGVEGMQESVPFYFSEEDEDYRFYAESQKGLDEITSHYTDDICEDIHVIMAKLRKRGLEQVIVVDLTRPDIGIPTVRVIVPGMEATCFDKSRKGERLLNAFAE